ncbi:MAG: ABC transporter ATP-binding protein/permease [Deltaproteobacteria bacterium]|jgi:ABC-type multidrug transport system fused ATPase/permease subunit|nr:ABC transporter ATP-binding protein/permease [Deltaproteobacteria bacterium]
MADDRSHKGDLGGAVDIGKNAGRTAPSPGAPPPGLQAQGAEAEAGAKKGAEPQTDFEGLTEEERSRPMSMSDIKLLLRLWPVTKPFRVFLGWGTLMIIAAALVSLALPYLTKISLDRYILPLGRVFHMESPEGLTADQLGRLKPEMFEAVGPGEWLLPASEAALIDRRQERTLADEKVLDPEKYYFRAVDGEGGLGREEAESIARQAPGARIMEGQLALTEQSLAGLGEPAALVLRGADISGLRRLAILFSLLMVVGYAFDVGQRYFMEAGAQKLGHYLRETLLAHLYGLSQSFFDRQQTARLTSRLTSDINNINNLVKSTAASFFSDILSLAGVMIIMFALSPRLAAAALILTPLAAILSYHFSRIARLIQRDLRAKVAAINQAFNEAVAGMGVIQAFRREKKTAEEFAELNRENYLTGYRQVHSVAIFLPLVDLCSSLVLGLILWVGGLGVLDNTVSLGVLAAFVGYANRFFNPIKDLAEKVNTFQSAFASLERLVGLLEIDDRTLTGTRAPVRGGGRVEFKNVSFRYSEGGPLVLDDVSFDVEKGQSVALVGSTGSGKSSLINLMLRFYDPVSGVILFDDADLRELDLRSHRRRVGLVTQDVYLYSASVLDNLRLGRTDLSEETVRRAAEAVGADGFIRNLPGGYRERLGPGGRGISAGQKQLIACARALIEAPEIVILDEATAFVDSEAEMLIEEAMKTLFKGRTSVIIAHRLSTIRRADRIMVLHRGRLIENGDHASLVAKKGFYYHLAKLQGLAD